MKEFSTSGVGHCLSFYFGVPVPGLYRVLWFILIVFFFFFFFFFFFCFLTFVIFF